ncbi:hypothetical protein [Asticcacaulis sp. YBE204]|uniref:hypothetical protein n=1 Tax=Asticcacaulis sp. YBE204 TaxID=1282363 RepID=UPI0003C3BDA7|nr:hypothetical protein [Asticcacaulis sp. YBE204]ESQ80199.1 hypothetical protein AEYBE204_06150 [Asticcacaulis sp. YBE204]
MLMKIIKAIGWLGLMLCLIFLLELRQSSRNGNLSPTMEVVANMILVLGLIIIFWFQRAGARKSKTRKTAHLYEDGFNPYPRHLTGYGETKDSLEDYSLSRLVLIGFILAYGLWGSLIPPDLFPVTHQYIGLGILAVSFIYWLALAIRLRSFFKPVLRLLFAVIIFAVSLVVYACDLLTLTLENNPYDPVVGSLIAAWALVASTLVFKAKRRI